MSSHSVVPYAGLNTKSPPFSSVKTCFQKAFIANHLGKCMLSGQYGGTWLARLRETQRCCAWIQDLALIRTTFINKNFTILQIVNVSIFYKEDGIAPKSGTAFFSFLRYFPGVIIKCRLLLPALYPVRSLPHTTPRHVLQRTPSKAQNFGMCESGRTGEAEIGSPFSKVTEQAT